MRHERLRLGEDVRELAHDLRARVAPSESVREAVAEIIAAVRERGDDAVLEYTRRFDSGHEPVKVEQRELDAALAELDPDVRAALEQARDNVEAVAGEANSQTIISFGEHSVSVHEAPVHRAAVYVPGGRAPYPSTVVMGVVPAQVAGVHEVVVATPSSAVLGACALLGVGKVHRVGGAQAIAALAYGTETIDPVDVIVGPGNLYVQEAKRQVFGQVGIDGFAGPSDLVVIADADADPDLISLDLLAQAEHGSGSLVIAISSNPRLLDALATSIADAPETGALAAIVEVPDVRAGLELAEEFAPEHLQLIGAAAEALADHVTRAGCVFVGAESGTAFGDYIAGSNHILPTNGAARFASGLSPAHFLRRITTVRIGDASELARAAAPLARAEGFELHARSMEQRIRDNHPR